MTRYVPPTNYSKPEPGTPFAEQAAKFSMYAPLAAFLINCCIYSNKERSAVMALMWLGILLIVAGFGLGIFALISVKKYGPERILGRAIVGVILNGLALAMILYVVNFAASANAVKQQVAGTWRMTSGGDANIKQLDITFNKDGTFKMDSKRIDGLAVVVTGKWDFSPTKLITVTIQNVVGGDGSLNGKRMGLGNVKSVDSREMTLRTDKGEEKYKRLP